MKRTRELDDDIENRKVLGTLIGLICLMNDHEFQALLKLLNEAIASNKISHDSSFSS